MNEYAGKDFLTFATHSFGCKTNRSDLDPIISKLTDMGMSHVPVKHTADILIVNTCTVTSISDKKSKQMIRRLRRSNPDSFVAVCGCMVHGRKACAEDLGADFLFDAREPEVFLKKVNGYNRASAFKAKYNPGTPVKRTRAVIKIQDGCERFCSYCIVPYVRGPIKSKPLDQIMAEAVHHVQSGVLEIVLTGIQVAAYGTDSCECNLAVLIEKVGGIKGLGRLRLSSVDPWAVDDSFLGTLVRTPSLCSHFHLSLQSGSDTVLRLMNRRYTTAEYATITDSIRTLRPNSVFTTDIIVGFPGETEALFLESYEFVKQMGFVRVHVFEYSKRDGTAAALMLDDVSTAEKNKRSKMMRDLAYELMHKHLQKHIGTVLPVLFVSAKMKSEPYSDTQVYKGLTEDYSEVEVKSTKDIVGTIRNVIITSVKENILAGCMVGT